MTELTVNNGKNDVVITYYDHEKQLPAYRYNEFQKYCLIAAGVGSDMDAVLSHFSRLFSFIAAKQHDEVSKEAENLYFNHYAVLSKTSFVSYCLACLVKSIGPVMCDDFTDEGLQRIVALIDNSGITQQQIEDIVETVKKK